MRWITSLAILVLVSAGGAWASPQGKRVAILATLNTNPYIGSWTSTFIKDAGALGMKVTNFSSPYDAAIQSQQVDDAIGQKFDLILVNDINEQAILPALTRAKQAGIPVMLFATPIRKENENLFVSYIGTDHHELGRIAGENLVMGLMAEGKTKANVIAITGLAQQLNVQQRMEGFRAALAQHPGFTLLDQEDGKWNTAASETIAGQLLVRFAGRGGVDGIFGMADNQATGAIEALESAGMKPGVASKGVVVVASNCMKEGMIHIKSGEQYSTATQIPTEEAAFAAKRIAAYFNGETLKKYEIVPAHGITQDNLAQFGAACSY